MALNKKKVLQTPNDFQRVMEATRQGKSGLRPMRVVQLGSVYDWKAYFEPLNLMTHNVVQKAAMTLENKEACHVFRFFRRDCMNNIPGGLGEAVTPKTCFEDPPAGDDIILVTKHLLSSESYAAPPQAQYLALAVPPPSAIGTRAFPCDVYLNVGSTAVRCSSVNT